MDHEQPLAVVPEAVECAGLDQGFHDPLVAHRERDLAQEVVEAGVAVLVGAGADDAVDDVFTYVADGAQPEPDVFADGGKSQLRFVDVGREYFDAHPPGFSQIDGHFVLGSTDRCEQGCHVLGGVVGFEIGGPVGHQPVPGGVGFVEAVGGERHQHVPNRLRGLGGVAVLLHAGGEQGPLLVHLLFFLLAHRPAQDVGATEGVPRQLLGDRHDLLLVDHQVVGLTEDGVKGSLQFRVNRGDLLLAALAERVIDVGFGLHWARASQGKDCGDVLEPGGGHQLGQVPHHGGVELEYPEGLSGGQQLICLGVVQGGLEHVQVDVAVGLDIDDRIA